MKGPEAKLLSRGLALGLFLISWLLVLSGSTAAGPLSERIVMVAESQGLDKLYICRSDGRDVRRLTAEKGNQQDPTYSYALDRFFFVRLNNRRGEICSVNSEGQDFIVHVDSKADALNPTVHPEGKHLAFSTDRWGSRELALYHLETGNIERLTYDQGTSTHPQYSPDGKSIAFLSRRHGQSEIYLLNTSDRTSRRITNTPFHEGPAEWSPDGERLIATRIRPPRERNQLVEIRLTNGRERYLLSQSKTLALPSYSVDGNQILFVEDSILKTFDKSDTKSFEFPLKGTFRIKDASWIKVPLP